MAVNNLHKYAAMISVCAATMPMSYINSLTALPVWFFLGKKDDIVPAQQTIDAYKKINTLEAAVKITIYPDAYHDSWTRAFENDEIYDWLMEQRLDK